MEVGSGVVAKVTALLVKFMGWIFYLKKIWEIDRGMQS